MLAIPTDFFSHWSNDLAAELQSKDKDVLDIMCCFDWLKAWISSSFVDFSIILKKITFQSMEDSV